MRTSHETLQQRFGQLLTFHRRRLKLKQAELAVMVDVSTEMIGRMEQGKTGASFATIDKLCVALGVEAAELFSAELVRDHFPSETLRGLFVELASLTEADQAWISELIQVALHRRKF